MNILVAQANMDQNQVKHIGEQFGKKGLEVETISLAYSVREVINILRRNRSVDVVILSYKLDRDDVAVSIEELEKMRKSIPDISILLCVAKGEQGSEYMMKLFQAGFYKAFYETDGTIGTLVSLIQNGRDMLAAREYYGLPEDRAEIREKIGYLEKERLFKIKRIITNTRNPKETEEELKHLKEMLRPVELLYVIRHLEEEDLEKVMFSSKMGIFFRMRQYQEDVAERSSGIFKRFRKNQIQLTDYVVTPDELELRISQMLKKKSKLKQQNEEKEDRDTIDGMTNQNDTITILDETHNIEKKSDEFIEKKEKCSVDKEDTVSTLLQEENSISGQYVPEEELVITEEVPERKEKEQVKEMDFETPVFNTVNEAKQVTDKPFQEENINSIGEKLFLEPESTDFVNIEENTFSESETDVEAKGNSEDLFSIEMEEENDMAFQFPFSSIMLESVENFEKKTVENEKQEKEEKNILEDNQEDSLNSDFIIEPEQTYNGKGYFVITGNKHAGCTFITILLAYTYKELHPEQNVCMCTHKSNPDLELIAEKYGCIQTDDGFQYKGVDYITGPGNNYEANKRRYDALFVDIGTYKDLAKVYYDETVIGVCGSAVWGANERKKCLQFIQEHHIEDFHLIVNLFPLQKEEEEELRQKLKDKKAYHNIPPLNSPFQSYKDLLQLF